MELFLLLCHSVYSHDNIQVGQYVMCLLHMLFKGIFAAKCCCHNANGITKFTHKCVLFFLVASIIADISLITEKALQDFIVI